MSNEGDSWLQQAFGLDVQQVIGAVSGEAAPADGAAPAATASITSGAGEFFASAGRAIVDVAKGDLQMVEGVAIKGIAVVAGASSAVASAVGSDASAQELAAAQRAADADAGSHFDQARRSFDAAGQQVFGGDEPPPTERPDPPEGGGPPTDRPKPIPPPPPTERPDRPPDGDEPPTERDPRRRGGADSPESEPF